LSRANGKAIPEKLLPPPWQAMTTSGYSPATFICSWASRPMTVWCMHTWLSTDPSEYFVSSCVAASSTASEMAIPSEPLLDGSLARMLRPALVRSVGEATTSAPQVRIIERR